MPVAAETGRRPVSAEQPKTSLCDVWSQRETMYQDGGLGCLDVYNACDMHEIHADLDSHIGG